MRKEDTKRYEEMSEKVFGHKYAYRKMLSARGKRKGFPSYRGLILDHKPVPGAKKPAYTCRRQCLTEAGVMEYMQRTLKMREELKKELQKKKENTNEERGQSPSASGKE